jgi:5-formyltetrahydrofolate cyclo-ligase
MQKKELRSLYLAKRMGLSSFEKSLLEEKIAENLFSNFSFSGKVTSCFLPIEAKHEIDTWSIIAGIQKNHGHIAIPVWDTASNALVHRTYIDGMRIAVNSYGIPEPQNGIVISNDVFDYVLVPLLAVDRLGARVGYGKGVYDRFLAECSPKTLFIGLSFFELIDCIEDTDVYDIPLHYCITPTNCYSFEK